MKPLLSKKSIRLLEDNGYKYYQKGRTITFQNTFDYISIVVISGLVLFIGVPMILFNIYLGILTILLALIGLLLKYTRFSKKMKFTIDLPTQKFDFFDKHVGLANQSLSYASKIILNSKFKDEYSSAFKTTSEEHIITIRLELKSGRGFTCFKFHSDYAKPSEEILEIYKLLKKLVRFTKNKQVEPSAA
ncbi:MAG: hypothetical protein AAF551_01115 [Bacteroidota bacterium]